ncbi:MAG: T9SS type A sorting domain-containing protein [Bacteroidota bacterium]
MYIHFDAFRDRSLSTFEGLLTDKKWRFSTGKLLTSQTPKLSGSPQMVFPNPSTGRIYLGDSYQNFRETNVYNLVGELIQVYGSREGKTIDLSNLSPGLYILEWVGLTGIRHIQGINIQ